MLDLINEYNFAVSKVQQWRTTYDTQNYPHKVVINMMYRAYSTDIVFNLFEQGKLNHFSDFSSAAQYVMQMYAQASRFVNPNLMTWLNDEPEKAVGTIIYSRYEAMATKAENSKKEKEELEFSYLFETLNDFAALYYIAMRLTGKNEIDSISSLCGVIIGDLPYYNYTIIKQVFQRFWISGYLDKNYKPLP